MFRNGDQINNIINLTAGRYQITSWQGGQTYGEYNEQEFFPFVNVKIHKSFINTTWYPPTTSYTHTKKNTYGFRIKSIKDFTNNNELASEKQYNYITDFETNFPSGQIIGFKPTPKITSAEYLACASNSSPLGTCKSIATVTLTSDGFSNSQYLGYSSVFETTNYGTNTIGYSQSKFNVGNTGLISQQNAPAMFDPVYQNGKISEKNIYNKSKKLLQNEKFIYSSDNIIFEASSFAFSKSPYTTYAYWNPGTGLQYIQGECSFVGVPMPGPAQAPSNFSNHEWKEFDLGKYSFGLTTQNITGKFGYLSKKETTTFPESGGEIKKSEEYIFNEADNFRLQSKITKNSDTDIKTETYTYHPDYPLNPEKITNISITDNNGLLAQRENVYNNIGTTTNGIANVVSEIKTAKGDNALESRLLLDYDSTTKNIITTISPTTASPANDSFDSYIFGYNNMFPVAKLSGVKFNQISTSRLDNIKNLTNIAITPSSELAVATELNKLRFDFPNAQITTYTYNPVIGVTSETNPSGDVKYFEYDELSRLKRIKDKNGNILTENEYKYKYN